MNGGRYELHWLEKVVLVTLSRLGKPSTYQAISSEAVKTLKPQLDSLHDQSMLDTLANPSSIAKACGWLKEKGLVQISVSRTVRSLVLGEEGVRYVREGLPERRLVNRLVEMGGTTVIDHLKDMPDYEIGINWGLRLGWLQIVKDGSETRVSLRGETLGKTDQECLLEILAEKGELDLDGLGPELGKAADQLLSRKRVVSISERKVIEVELTQPGWGVASTLMERPLSDYLNEVTRLTPYLLSSGRWRLVTLSRYNVAAPVEPIFTAKRHPLAEVIRMVKKTYVEMGFEEIEGPIVELAFWNFDALFQPQDHPAREMQDTFYLSHPSCGELPREYVERVKAVHEYGGDTGSRGWGYKWSEEEARRLLLRTHTTATTIRHLAKTRNPPIKVFSVDRIYRNEKVDWKHLAEFHQIEGIVVERGATLRQLMGVLKEFYLRLGLHQVRFRPSYFPYTEPSMEVEVRLGDRWLELGGSGIFRPETTHPFHVEHPVLAWGLGLERLAMVIYNIEDIRAFHQNDLGWLRKVSPLEPYRFGGRAGL
ncbi:MAG: phenylalanine--tRNA ligase subunit alpha [Nitrososphaerota archaeon]